MGKKRRGNSKRPKLFGKRILAWCDTPRVATGFGIVAKHVLTHLAKQGALIDIIGINDTGGWYDVREFPFRIYPAMPGSSYSGDVYGRPLLAQVLLGKHPEIRPPYDYIWVLGDHFILEQKGRGVFSDGAAVFLKKAADEWKKKYPDKMKLVLYTPVDSTVKENWVEFGMLPFDRVVTYTKYAKNEILKACPPDKRNELENKLFIIPHGVDFRTFKPLPKVNKDVFTKDGWLKDEDFLIVNVNRNQPRKDIFRTLMVFQRFNMIVPNSKLYLHLAAQDVGGNVNEMMRTLGLDPKLVRMPQNWNAVNALPADFLNLIYNCADVVITTTLGEGWGFSITEAMACGKPIVAHNVTSITEILGLPPQDFETSDLSNNKIPLPPATEHRGLGVRTSDFICLGTSDLERPRPIASVSDFVEKLLWVYENENEAKMLGGKARAWLIKENLTWQAIGEKFEKVLDF